MVNPFQPSDFDDSNDSTSQVNRHVGSDYAESREYWPTCPQCGKRLTVSCPICRATDDLFPLGDVEYWSDDLGQSLIEHQHKLDQQISAQSVLFGEGDTTLPYDEHSRHHRLVPAVPSLPFCGSSTKIEGECSCSGQHENHCDPHGESPHKHHQQQHHHCRCDGHDKQADGSCGDSLHNNQTPDDASHVSNAGEDAGLPFVVICPTCSEPFIPDFPSGCRHCGRTWNEKETEEISNDGQAESSPENEVAIENDDHTHVTPFQLAVVLIIAVTIVLLLTLIPK